MSSVEEAVFKDSRGASSISLVEVAEVVKKLLSGKSPEVDEIRPEMLKALDIVGLSWLTRLFNDTWRLGTTYPSPSIEVCLLPLGDFINKRKVNTLSNNGTMFKI